jgi:hypothetical protein
MKSDEIAVIAYPQTAELVDHVNYRSKREKNYG